MADALDLPKSDEEAEERYQLYRDVDPFPEVPPALLNAADIIDYVAATGMIWPFVPAAHMLKPASYEIPLGGDYTLWDEKGEEQSEFIGVGDPFELPKNSIAFVSLAPMFRVPSYIAIRFNLRITHIYQGVLLGTGPLVDPGFRGHLSIPLHNLTDNDYTLVGGQGLIWMEFTKLSPTRDLKAAETPPPRRGQFTPLPDEKLDLKLADYLRKANPHGPVQSSLPRLFDSSIKAAEEARDSAQHADEQATEARESIHKYGLFAIIGVAVAALAVIVGLLQLYTAMSQRIDDLEHRIPTTTVASPASKSPAIATTVPQAGGPPSSGARATAPHT